MTHQAERGKTMEMGTHRVLSLFAILSLLVLPVSIQAAVHTMTPGDTSLPQSSPGDTIEFESGNYTKLIKVNGLKGTKESPIVMKPKKKNGVVFKGDVPIDLDWKPAGEGTWTAETTEHPHMLYHDGKFLRHVFAKDVFPRETGVYRVTGKDQAWTVAYRPLAGKIEGSYTRGIIQSFLQIENCENISLEGFRIENTGPDAPPSENAGMFRFGGSLITIGKSKGITIRQWEVSGWMGSVIVVRGTDDFCMENSRIRNGYGGALTFTAIYAGETPDVLYSRNRVISCEFSHITQFDPKQSGFLVEAIAVDGNALRKTEIRSNEFHDLGKAKPIHFDVRSGDALVEGNLFRDNQDNQIYMENRIFDVVIRNNLFLGKAGSTLGLKNIGMDRCLGIRVEQNLFYNSALIPCEIYGSYNWTVANNIIFNEGRAALAISHQALKKEKIDRGLITMDGRNLYQFLKGRGLPVPKINENLVWAGVAPLNPDGSEPDHISWKSPEEMKAAGYSYQQFMSARKNPNGNGIDMEVPSVVVNMIRGNVLYTGDSRMIVLYDAKVKTPPHEPNETLQGLVGVDSAWTGNIVQNPDFKAPGQFDFSHSMENKGPDKGFLTHWEKVLKGRSSGRVGEH